MVLDTSALVAILTGEPEQRSFIAAIDAADSRLLSTASYVESSIVIEARYGAAGVADLDLFLRRATITLVPVDEEQALAARRAFSRFGRGRPAAGLNYGDCFSYALASVSAEPLLCKGSDFRRTDIVCVQTDGEP